MYKRLIINEIIKRFFVKNAFYTEGSFFLNSTFKTKKGPLSIRRFLILQILFFTKIFWHETAFNGIMFIFDKYSFPSNVLNSTIT
jgi:hypothetical protein